MVDQPVAEQVQVGGLVGEKILDLLALQLAGAFVEWVINVRVEAVNPWAGFSSSVPE